MNSKITKRLLRAWSIGMVCAIAFVCWQGISRRADEPMSLGKLAVQTVQAQATLTPNLNLNIPIVGTPNWGPLMNANFSALDSYLSGVTAIPALKFTTPGGLTTSVLINNGQFIGSTGSLEFIPGVGTVNGIESYSVGLTTGSTGDFYCHNSIGNPTKTCYFADNSTAHLANSYSENIAFASQPSTGCGNQSCDVLSYIRATPISTLEISTGATPGASPGGLRFLGIPFASLPASGQVGGDQVYCNDCKNTRDAVTAGAACVAGGTHGGAYAMYRGGEWDCF